jgi:subtilisin family serine protease
MMYRISILTLFCLFVISCSFAQHSLILKTNSSNLASILTNFSSATQRTYFLQDIQTIKPLVSDHPVFSKYFVVEYADSIKCAQARLRWQENPEVEQTEQNYTRKLNFIPSDPDYNKQWYHKKIQSESAWDITKGDASIKIGVIDTGIDYSHPDLKQSIWVNPSEDINGNGIFDPKPVAQGGDLDGIDQDNNGYIDDVIGYDFTHQPRLPFGGDYLFEDPIPFDENGHGTLVTGIISAQHNNIGIAGVAPNCKIVVLRAFSASGIGEDDDIARAIIYAADNNIPILNFSFGDIYPSVLMHDVIQYAYQKNITMVASAGNGIGDDPHYPSNFPEVIAVSASDFSPATNTEFLWQFSGYGINVDLCAPGSGIYTTAWYDSSATNPAYYGTFSGTSTAAPMVTGAAALLKSKNNTLLPSQIRTILCSSADDIGNPGWDNYTGAGRLNIHKALLLTGTPMVQILSPANDTGSDKNSVAITGNVLHPNLLKYHLYYAVGIENPVIWQNIVLNQNTQKYQDTVAVWNITSLQDTSYTLRLVVELTNGSTIEDRVHFVKDKTPPVIQIKNITPIWDNDEQKIFVEVRANDVALHQLYYKPLSTSTWQTLTFDKHTKNAHFLIPNNFLISNATYTAYVKSTNRAGLSSQTPAFNFVSTQKFISKDQYAPISNSPVLPMGRYLSKPTDLNNNGKKEVVLTLMDNSSNFRGIYAYEYNVIQQFSAIDSLKNGSSGWIIKDVADIDNDAKFEMLYSIQDSFFVTTQATGQILPKQITYSNLKNGYYAANFVDVNQDNLKDVIVKDFKDYFVFQNTGSGFSKTFTLPDASSNYQGSVAPRILHGDFDNDGNLDLIYGTLGGNILIYEYNGSGFNLIYKNETNLWGAGEFLVQGDFDNDGKQDFCVITRTSTLKNDDKEYDAPFWKMRFFHSNGNNQFFVKDSLYFYETASTTFNACIAHNVDNQAGEEVIFSFYPKTYIIRYNSVSQKYEPQWFYYGSINSSHIAHDFNNNGKAEFSIGDGLKATFFEYQDYVVQPTYELMGFVTGSSSTLLKWQRSATAGVQYRVYRSKGFKQTLPTTVFNIGLTADTLYKDSGLSSDSLYLYALEVIQGTNVSPLSYNTVILRPHALNRLDSVQYIGNQQCVAYFSNEMNPYTIPLHQIRLNDTLSPQSAITLGNTKQLLLKFNRKLPPATYTLTLDTTILDRESAYLNPLYRMVNFVVSPQPEENAVIFSRWFSINEHEAIVEFNTPVTNTALQKSNYTLTPIGRIENITWEGTAQQVIKVKIQQAAFGALGNPLSIQMKNIIAVNGWQSKEGIGDVATFTQYKENLDEVFVYPNPYRVNTTLNGVRFANLTKTAKIKVFTVNGRLVKELEEKDGDGGCFWDLRDITGAEIPSGVYLFYAEDDKGQKKVSKFAVVR